MGTGDNINLMDLDPQEVMGSFNQTSMELIIDRVRFTMIYPKWLGTGTESRKSRPIYT